MDIKEIAKTMTREEFMNKFDHEAICIKQYGFDMDKCQHIACHDCAEKIIKVVKFRGEDEKNPYETWEVYKPENKGKKFKRLKDNEVYEFIDGCLSPVNGREGDEYDTISVEDKWVLVQEHKQVEFMDAVKSGKRVRVEHEYIENQENKHYKNYQNLWELFSNLVQDFCSEGIQDIVLNGTWYVEG